ncbi:hypothetical protein G6F68_020534 [Rhizopus microsporus]|nr:hypothetical protein G6F68_020534 [Rhizopus microsporus]
MRGLAGADVLPQRGHDVAVARFRPQPRRPLVKLLANVGEGGAVEFRAVQRRAAVQVQVVALLAKHLEQL